MMNDDIITFLYLAGRYDGNAIHLQVRQFRFSILISSPVSPSFSLSLCHSLFLSLCSVSVIMINGMRGWGLNATEEQRNSFLRLWRVRERERERERKRKRERERKGKRERARKQKKRKRK